MDGLETAEYQIKLYAEMSEETQISLLKANLDDTDKLVNTMKTLTENWTTGNTSDLKTYFDKNLVKFPKLEDRNANWAVQLENLLEQPGDYFVVVSTAHMLGDQSVVKMLEDKGYKIARIDAD